MEKFINAAMVDRDQADPTLYTVLTAKSKHSQISLTDFLAFTPKWNVTSNTFRPPVRLKDVSPPPPGTAD